MKNVKSVALAAVLALGAAVSGNALAQGNPIGGGTAGIVYTPSLTTVAPCASNTTANPSGCAVGSELGIDVAINLTGMTGASCTGAATPLILGGYQIAMEFDNTRLFYAGVQSSPAGPACPALRPDEYSLPTATNATDANSTGTALFVAQNGASQTAPVGGPFCYFRIRLQGKTGMVGTQNATVRFRTNARGAYTLSSAVLNCAPNPNVGPVDIPKNNDISVVLVTTPVELTKFQAE